MPAEALIRPLAIADHADWRRLWDGYNAFYGRQGDTALPEPITESTWERLCDPAEPVRTLVAEHRGFVVHAQEL